MQHDSDKEVLMTMVNTMTKIRRLWLLWQLCFWFVVVAVVVVVGVFIVYAV